MRYSFGLDALYWRSTRTSSIQRAKHYRYLIRTAQTVERARTFSIPLFRPTGAQSHSQRWLNRVESMWMEHAPSSPHGVPPVATRHYSTYDTSNLLVARQPYDQHKKSSR